MRRVIGAVLLSCCVVVITFSGSAWSGGERPADWKRLRAAFPSTLPRGFALTEVAGDVLSGAAFMQASYEKQVRASGPGPDDAAEHLSIDVQIWDLAGSPDEARERIAVQEAGERAVTVRGSFPGRERMDRDGGACAGSEVLFLVRGRFLVSVRSANVCDLPLFRALIGSMDLASLPK